jgi:hypothetical protein
MERLLKTALELVLAAAAGAAEGSTPGRLAEINREDLALWRRLVREAGIPLE